ncbi:MAG TPA: glycosyltransferase family 39 protein [Bryobacteraceae bacterium]|nr:glycosyltransferase family 39 protein [Bryobacteraceae bacterium]
MRLHDQKRPAGVLYLLPWLLALFFALWGLRGIQNGNIIDTDAARHAMNGAFLHDLVRDGEFTRPMQYAKAYYGRYPALSLPYHPPLFPLVESVFFFGFGVNLVTARILVALFVALAAVLLYRLIRRTHGSHLLAFLATATFFWINGSQRVAADVMLEFPSLALAIAALLFLEQLEPRLTLGRALGFAAFAGAAMWTKQNVLFFIALPMLYVVLARRWRLLREVPVWAATAAFGIAVAGVIAVQKLSPFTHNTTWPQTTLPQTVLVNIPYYLQELTEEFGLVATIVVLAGVAFAVFRPRPAGNALYAAWAIAGLGLVAVLPPRDPRYLFFIYPALAVLGYSLLAELGRRLLGARRAWAMPAAAAAAWMLLVAQVPHVYLRGPAEAARVVAAAGPERVLYCGRTNGTFIFSVRSMDGGRHFSVLRGDKLPAEVFAPGAFEAFAHEYGIQQIVLERNKVERRAWDKLFDSPPQGLELVREIALDSSEQNLSGALRVFRFANPSPTPKSMVKIRMMSGEELAMGL